MSPRHLEEANKSLSRRQPRLHIISMNNFSYVTLNNQLKKETNQEHAKTKKITILKILKI